MRRVGVLAVILSVGVAAICLAEELPKLGFKCENEGQDFRCVAFGVEDLEIAPLWILHSKHPFQSYGYDLEYKAPAQWTVIEMRAYPNDQTGAPHDGRIYIRSRGWVRQCNDRAVFYPYIEQIEPPSCQKMNRKN